MEEMQIRKANLDDLNLILEIEKEYEYEQYSEITIRESLVDDKNITFLGFCGKDVVGYVSANVILDESDLIKIIVCKKYRKNGLGEKLLTCLVAYLRDIGVKKIFLEVREDNNPAIALYEKLGFYNFYERQNYYNGIDAKIFLKDL